LEESKGHEPIQIQAEILRHRDAAAPFRARQGFVLMRDPQTDATEEKSGGRGRWREADLKRALAVAKEAGLQAYRIEIAPDGTISIVVGGQAPSTD
jgi:hypothetical protein